MPRPTPRSFLAGAAVLAALVLLSIQFVPIARTNPPIEADLAAPAEIKDILRRACYDCHSHETKWPWYSRVAPLSWWVAAHVEKGRADLNFSHWPVFDLETRGLFLRDIEKQILSIIQEHAPNAEGSIGRDSAIDELGIDSFSVVEIIFDVEDKLGIEIPFNANDATLNSAKNVGQILDAVVKFVDEKQTGNAADSN